MEKQLKIALPKGRLLADTAALLKNADWGLSTYHKGMPSYRPRSQKFPDIVAKVFHEKDIPIQVAVGHYDLGICGLDWVEELIVKYPSSALVKVRNLGYGAGALYVVASRAEAVPTVEAMQENREVMRIASEYPNLAQSFALNRRLRRFSVFPLWGAAEAYPPESADLALISGGVDGELLNHDLVAVSHVLGFNACLIANRTSWARKDLSSVLDSIESALVSGIDRKETEGDLPPSTIEKAEVLKVTGEHPSWDDAGGAVRLALPDGHQQKPALELLTRAGISFDDYPSPDGNRRPASSLDGVVIKVIRPQDMPLQVANGNFDLAITGKDWLAEHLYQFPSSPVTELLDLEFAGVKIVAVISKELPADDIYGLKQLYAGKSASIRVASEYVNIADKYARDNRLGVYRVIPTWGASEAFLPEDADLLIENTETGRTIARHNLKIIDTLFQSTGCLVANKESIASPARGDRIKSIAETLRAAVEDGKNEDS